MVHAYRIKHGMSMDAFAHLVGVTKSYISILEKGVNPKTGKTLVPSLITAINIANVLGVPLGDLVQDFKAQVPLSKPWDPNAREYDPVSQLLDAPDFRADMQKIFKDKTPKEVSVAKEQIKLLIKAIFLPINAKKKRRKKHETD